MIFETELGIKPSEWLKYAPLDDYLADNRIPILPVEDALISVSGLHITLLRLILASFLSIGAGIVHRFVPTATGANSASYCMSLSWTRACMRRRTGKLLTSRPLFSRVLQRFCFAFVAVDARLVMQGGICTLWSQDSHCCTIRSATKSFSAWHHACLSMVPFWRRPDGPGSSLGCSPSDFCSSGVLQRDHLGTAGHWPRYIASHQFVLLSVLLGLAV